MKTRYRVEGKGHYFNTLHPEDSVDVDRDEIDAAIEEDGWCGCYDKSGTKPLVVTLAETKTARAIRRYLAQ